MDTTPLALGLFDIMQVDPLADVSVAEMYAQRLDHLALADQLGYDVAFGAERHYTPGNVCAAATAWIAAASQRATRMRLGCMGWTLALKEPVELAEEIAVLDQLSNGRLEVGFGLGHRPDEFTVRGKDVEQRIPSFQRRLAMVRGLWTGGAVSANDGEIVLDRVALNPVPLQAPHPPLWFAGGDPMAAMWAGTQGMGLAIGFRPTADLQATVNAYRSGRGAMSGKPDAPSPLGDVALMRNVYIAESDDEAVADVIGDLMRLDAHFELPVVEGGEAAHRANVAERIAQMQRDDVMIVGGPRTVAEKIRSDRAVLGFDLFLAHLYGVGISPERVERTLRLLACPVRDLIARP